MKLILDKTYAYNPALGLSCTYVLTRFFLKYSCLSNIILLKLKKHLKNMLEDKNKNVLSKINFNPLWNNLGGSSYFVQTT